MKEKIKNYMRYLAYEEKSPSTIKQYLRDILSFFACLGNEPVTKERVIQYKNKLSEKYRPASVNAKIAALNSFFSYIELPQLRVKQLKIQRNAFSSQKKELRKAEYMRLVETAKHKGDEKLALMLQTICGTGIRVSELQFITAEAVNIGQAAICLKGKNRSVVISGKLRKFLREYMRKNRIAAGPVFVTRNGRPVDRSYIWKMMKALCESAGVQKEKVFPHNLRHLFATCFYSIDKDMARLADILGHSNINTTRIYIASFGYEHRKRIDSLGLVTI
ncbi:MAG: tyrosine-type recombinase/integrase [Clostridiales bacterium]|nr:tyrosine-type recombinase/integrase [Clostridiales bacterium]